jgi:hypothetical protein
MKPIGPGSIFLRLPWVNLNVRFVNLITNSRVLTSFSVQRSTLARQHRAGPAPSNSKLCITNTPSMSSRSAAVDV